MAAFLLLATTGCFSASRDFRGVSKAMAESLDTTVEAGPQFKLGRGPLFLARTVLGCIEDGDEDVEMARNLLRDLHRVEVGTYGLREGGKKSAPGQVLAALDTAMTKRGLEPVVRHQGQGELACVYVQVKGERIRQLYVVALGRTDLNVVRIQGRLDQMVARALREGDVDLGAFL
jgi:hypothetical protein